jgi:sigma-B regulation protein RsbU (phosphoserine phosphatase)
MRMPLVAESVLKVDVPDPKRLMAALQFLSELGQVVASNTEMQPILDWIVSKTTAMLGADEGSIRLVEPGAEGGGGHTFIRPKTAGHESGSWPRAIALSVMGYLLHHGDRLASVDLLNDERFPGLRGLESRVRSILAVPLRVENRVTGILAVTQAEPGRHWNESDNQLLSIVAGHSAGVIEQARLRAEALEKQRLEEERRRAERELDLARDIQMSFIPSRAITTGSWEILGRVVPARQVGGDAFDYFMVEGGRLCFAIADVAGKGVPAAILMSSVQASLRAFCDGRQNVPEAVRHINQSVARSASGKFITLFYGEFEAAGGRLRYTNAGHNYPLVRRQNGSVEELREGGLPLGLFEDADYQQGEIALAAGDSLLLYSDGISEAMDLRGREFGEDRLTEFWKQRGGGTAAGFIDDVLAEVERFRGTAAQSDDMTVVVLSARPAS